MKSKNLNAESFDRIDKNIYIYHTLVKVRLALAKESEILVFPAELKRGTCEEKRIWSFALSFVSFGQAKEKIKINFLSEA